MNRKEVATPRPYGTPGVPSVSFSGVDGAGKSTQIALLRSCLEEFGMRVRVIRFWDDVASLTKLREDTGHRIFRGEKGVGTPDAPVNRRDKNVRGWPMTCLRLFIYLLDAISLRRVYRRLLRSDADFIIFDRYIYDELANLEFDYCVLSAYARFIVRLVPKPNVSFVLDADPEAAQARKPEYPLEFMVFNRNAYFDLGRILGLVVIPPSNIETVRNEVLTRSLLLLSTVAPTPDASLTIRQVSLGVGAQSSHRSLSDEAGILQ